jgi:hypothetical protein
MCGLDRRHPALTGHEMRPCWVAATSPAEVEVPGSGALGTGDSGGRDGLWAGGGAGRPPRTFVPVESLVPAPVAAATAVLEMTAVAGDADPGAVTQDARGATAELPTPGPAVGTSPIPGRWWLWGDPEPWPDR